MTPEFEQKLIDGVQDEVGGKPIGELAKWRDELLVGVLQQSRSKPSPSRGG